MSAEEGGLDDLITPAEPTVRDFRERIRERLHDSAAKIVILWSDGKQSEYDIFNDYRTQPNGTLVGRTVSGEQIVLSSQVEWIVVGPTEQMRGGGGGGLRGP